MKICVFVCKYMAVVKNMDGQTLICKHQLTWIGSGVIMVDGEEEWKLRQ